MKAVQASSLELQIPLNTCQFSECDKIGDVYQKYLDVMPEYESKEAVHQLQRTMETVFQNEIGELSSQMNELYCLKGSALKSTALQKLLELQENVLYYKFKNPMLLLAALTHPSAKSFF